MMMRLVLKKLLFLSSLWNRSETLWSGRNLALKSEANHKAFKRLVKRAMEEDILESLT